MEKHQKEFSGKWLFFAACCFAGFEVGTFGGFQPDYLLTTLVIVAGLGVVGWSLYLGEKDYKPSRQYLAVIVTFTITGLAIGMVTRFFQLEQLYSFAIDTAVILIFVALVFGIDFFAMRLYLKKENQKRVVLAISIGYLLVGILSRFMQNRLDMVNMTEIILSSIVSLWIAWVLVRRWQQAVEKSVDDVSDSFVIRSFLLPKRFLS